MRRSLQKSVRLAAILVTAVVSSAMAQGGSDGPVAPSGGPLSDISGTLSDDSRPVHDPGGSLGEMSRGRLGGNSVRGSTSGLLSGGPVSDISAGAVRDPSIAPIPIIPVPSSQEGEPVPAAEPQGSLLPLQEQLEAIQPLSRETPEEEEKENSGEGKAQSEAETEADDAIGTEPTPEPTTPPEEAAEGSDEAPTGAQIDEAAGSAAADSTPEPTEETPTPAESSDSNP